MERSMRQIAGLVLVLVLVGIAGCASAVRRDAGVPQDHAADRRALQQVVAAWVARADHAWEQRNARLMFEGLPDAADTTAFITAPDGRSISREANIADLQRRMDMTTR